MHVFDHPKPTSRIVTVTIFLIALQVHSTAVAALLAFHSPTFTWRGINNQCPHIMYAHTKLLAQQSQRRRQDHHILHIAPQQLGEFEQINFANDENEEGQAMIRDERRVWLYDFVTTTTQQQSTMPYHEAWDLQKQLVEHQLSRIGKRPKDPPLYDQFVPTKFDDDNYDMDGDAIVSLSSSSLLGCDSIIMLQHDPVYTLGTASDPSFIRGYDENDSDDNNIPIVRIERGGEVTYHGPGQLTVYPILDLRGYKQDIHWYMRALEEVILLALEKAGVKGVSPESLRDILYH